MPPPVAAPDVTPKATIVQMSAWTREGQPVAKADFWTCDEVRPALSFKPVEAVSSAISGTVYLSMAYLDVGYGKIHVEVTSPGGKSAKPDRFLGLWRMDTGKIVNAVMRVQGLQTSGSGAWIVRVGLENPKGQKLQIQKVEMRDQPPEDSRFAWMLTDPWKGPYTGPTVKPADNTTLKQKIMVGYQGWFRTPNDPHGDGWVHWGNMNTGQFTIDVWPDVTQYPAGALEKAADVKTRSGKPGMLFSSAWPATADLHFRWMREHNIDGAFLQRFVHGDRFYSIGGTPEWVLASVREAAHRNGRLWAVEYDASGCPDAKLLETLTKDWKWFCNSFGVLTDSNYARENNKPVVFIWGLPFPDRKFTPDTADASVEFFKKQGAYVIGGIPGNWRTLDERWRNHIKKYDCVSPWMSQSYAEDIADFNKLGLAYYGHVKPGFSWANLMHLPGDEPIAYTAREGGAFYWRLLSKAAQAHVERLFVGMFDEYDEGTAIMPMSDDPPPTPERPGVTAFFFRGPGAHGHPHPFVLPALELPLGEVLPSKSLPSSDFTVKMSTRITFPKPGNYTFSLEGAPGDDATLFVGSAKVISTKNMAGTVTASKLVTVSAGQALNCRLEYRHGAAPGRLRLLWEGAGIARGPVPAEALKDAWGRFLTNEGKPSDQWLKLTRAGKEMLFGSRPPDSPMPQ